MELRIKGHLYEIESVNNEIIENRQGFPASEEGYRKTLESVADCGGAEMVDKVADKIKERIRAEGKRPKNRFVRRNARILLVEEGILPDKYLNKA
ncbi:hypothetical protein ACFQMM_03645 [Saliphagus sp. GCM10025308]